MVPYHSHYHCRNVTKLLGRLYYYNPNTNIPGRLLASVNNVVVGVALVGTLVGQLVFSYLGNKLGRKKVYDITLMLMVLCAIFSSVAQAHILLSEHFVSSGFG